MTTEQRLRDIIEATTGTHDLGAYKDAPLKWIRLHAEEALEALAAPSQAQDTPSLPGPTAEQQSSAVPVAWKYRTVGTAEEWWVTLQEGWAQTAGLEVIPLYAHPPAEAPQEPVAYMCPKGCGCFWRDNKDGTMSLFNGAQKSCAVCEVMPLDKLWPVSIAQNLFVDQGESGKWLVCVEGWYDTREAAVASCQKWKAAYSSHTSAPSQAAAMPPAVQTAVPSEQEAFEQWYIERWKLGEACTDQRDVCLDKISNGNYRMPMTQQHWEVWQARAALASPSAAPVERIADASKTIMNAYRNSREGRMRDIRDTYIEALESHLAENHIADAGKMVTPISDEEIWALRAEYPTNSDTILFSRELLARALSRTAPEWQPIETAPKNKTIWLGYFNKLGKWRTLRGQWFSAAQIEEEWEDPDGAEEGWYETSVEAEDPPTCWPTVPTHWMPLPASPLSDQEQN